MNYGQILAVLKISYFDTMSHIHLFMICRREVYHIQRELLRERTRCKALEEELENPMNIHRWRKLEVRQSQDVVQMAKAGVKAELWIN